MKSTVQTILATVIAAAIVGNVAMLFKFEGRLSRIEATLAMLTQQNHIAGN